MKMKGLLKIGFIGFGNFGGQVADALIKDAFACIAANASDKDFATLSDDVTKFLIGDGKGTGKSRENAKNFLSDHINVIKDPVLTKFIEENDVIVVGGSAGGGFGSGATPSFAMILKECYPDKCVRVITTFPSLTETYEAQNHTEQFMEEVLSLNIPYTIYDNEKFNKDEANVMNDKIIKNVVQDMKIIRGDYILDTTSGGIDERDLLTLLSTPGRTVCTLLDNFEESMIDGTIVNTIKKSIDASGNAAMAEDKIIDASGLMYNLTGDLKKYGSTVSSDLQNMFGAPIGDFRNETVDGDDKSFVAVILAGLTGPTARIDKVINKRQSIETEKEAAKAASTKLGSVEPGKLSLGSKSFTSTSKPNVDDILKRFAKK